MGGRIGHRLLAAGTDLTVWNRTRVKLASLEAAGARVAATPREAVHGADVVITMLTDGAALAAVSEGPDGFAVGLAHRATVVDMSTVGAAALDRLAAALPDPTALAAAPVLGSLAEAEAGTLRILLGGETSRVEHVTPTLRRLGEVLCVGGVRQAAAAKLVVNAALFAVVASLGEVLALGQALSLERSAVLDLLALTPLAEQADRRRPALDSGEFPPRFRLDLARKDAGLIQAASRVAGTDLRLLDAAAAWLAEADEHGWREYDYSAVLQHILGEARPSEAG